MFQSPSSTPGEGRPGQPKKDEVGKKVVAAVAVLIAAGATLVLPPIANPQFAQAISTLRQPVVEATVAVVFVALAALWLRATVVIFIVVLLFAGSQLTYFLVTTSDGRAALDADPAWTTTSTGPPPGTPVVADGSTCLENTPNELGKAKECWQPDGTIDIDLNDTVGTTQQGLIYEAGAAGSQYIFSAKVDKLSGTRETSCPLFLGRRSIYDYYIFYVQEDEPGKFVAKLVHRMPRPDGQKGFVPQVFATSNPLPYVKYWNIIRGWEGESYRLAIRANGDRYSFYVNDRKQFDTPNDGRLLPETPPHQVTVGVVAVTNGVNDTLCSFSELKIGHS
jgi:hypothetical protein